jgi:hypothetical protein
MRHLTLLGIWTLLGTLLVAAGVYLLLPNRNMHGNPRAEHELASCVLADDAEVKLYQGDSSGTSATWFSVTHDPPGPALERQIIYHYRSPALYDLVCDSAGVVIQSDSALITLTAEQAKRLRDWPADAGRATMTRLAGGAALVLAGAGLLWFLRPRRDDGLDV